MVDSIGVLGITSLILDGSIDVPQATFHALADSIGVQCATFGILAVSFGPSIVSKLRIHLADLIDLGCA